MFSALALSYVLAAPIDKDAQIISPALVVVEVAKDIVRLVDNRIYRPEEIPFQIWFSFHTLPPADRADFQRIFTFWLNHLSASPRIVRLEYLQDNLIGRLDVRDAPNWTRTGWQVVGNRDYLFREPNIPHLVTQFVRDFTGVKQDRETLAVGSVLNAWQFFRDTIESNRVSSYYDILYGKQRHPDGIVLPPSGISRPAKIERKVVSWEGGKWKDGKEYPAGSFTYYKDIVIEPAVEASPFPRVIPSEKKGDANFPATGKDFETIWGADVSAEALKKLGVDPRVGGIALGKLDGNGAGSFVALRTRAIRVTPSAYGNVSRTFDVFRSQGDKDHRRRFGQISKGEIGADGSEILATLPNGAQAGLLCNDKDERVEIAPSDLAQVDSKIDKFADVRTHMSCIVCHAPFGGFIPFNEQVRAALEAGIKLSAQDDDPAKQRQKARDVEAFYLDWEYKVKGWQAPYYRFIEQTTFDPKTKQSWKPAEAVKQLQRFRDEYDKPLKIDQACRELGVSPAQLRIAILAKKPVEIGPNELVVGRSISRDSWESSEQGGVARECYLLLDACKEHEERVKLLLKDGLIEEAINEFKKQFLGEKKK
jgi:hypothetical protein